MDIFGFGIRIGTHIIGSEVLKSPVFRGFFVAVTRNTATLLACIDNGKRFRNPPISAKGVSDRGGYRRVMA